MIGFVIPVLGALVCFGVAWLSYRKSSNDGINLWEKQVIPVPMIVVGVCLLAFAFSRG